MAEANCRMLRVSEIPDGTTEDSLQFFFENKRKTGGGDIEDINYDEENHTAIITFEEENVVQRVLDSMPLLFQSKMIKVEAHISITEDITNISSESDLEGSPSDVNAVKVSGFGPTVTEETLRYYFEGKKGANADVININPVDEGHAYILAFENEEDVEVVLKKKHTIGKSQLTVIKYKPPPPVPKYPNKIFVSNINSSASEDALLNYLELKSKVEPLQIEKGDKEGTGLVTFKEPIDIQSLQQQCQKRSLEGKYLVVSSVPMTKCIVITGFKDTTSADTLEFYFDNKKRSGVEGVVDKKMDDEGQCFLYFEDYDAPVTACQRSHTVEGAKLKVHLHYECLGSPIDENEPFELPPTLMITGIDKRKMQFLKESSQCQEDMAKFLQPHFACITWPSLAENKDTLEIECTLQQSVKQCRKLAKSWRERCEKEVLQYLVTIEVFQHHTLQEAWADVTKKVKSLACSGITLIAPEQESNSIIVIGIGPESKDVSDKVSLIISEIEKKLDETKKQTTDLFTTKKYEACLLALINFGDQIMQDVEKVQVEIDVGKKLVTFTGMPGSIAKAKMKMLEKMREIVSSKLDKLSSRLVTFLGNQEVQNIINEMLCKKRLISTWSIVGDSSVMVYAFSDKEACMAAQAFKDCVTETSIDVDETQVPILKSKEWHDFIQTFEQETQDKVVRIEFENTNCVTVCLATASDINLGEIREKTQDFLHMNAINDYQMKLKNPVKRFLQDICNQQILQMSANLNNLYVMVSFVEDGILIKGNQKGISEAKLKLEEMKKNIVSKSHSINKVGIAQHMQSIDGKAKMSQVERNNGVVLSMNQEEEGFQDTPKATVQHNKVKETASCSTGTGQTIITTVGDITELDVDVVVNASNQQLDHVGGLAKVIVAKGGPDIQQDCQEFLRRKHMAPGDVYFGKAGKLKCKMVAHAVGPVYQDGRHKEEAMLSECILSSLKQATQRNFNSIAIPALCAGNYGYPVQDACRVITQAIKEFTKKYKRCSIQKIYLCDLNEVTIEYFIVSMQKYFGQSSVILATPSHISGKSHHGSNTASKRAQHRRLRDQPKDMVDLKPEQKSRINITLVRGQLSNQEVDVIVNSTSAELNLTNGAVSKSLLAVGGNSLQIELNQKYPNGVKPGEIAITAGGKLECRNVYHGALPNWANDNDNASKKLELFVETALSNASGSGFSCMAFPALGTGMLGYPKEEVARTMFDTVERFGKRQYDTSLVDVRFVIYEKDEEVYKAFEKEKQVRKRRLPSDFQQTTPQHTGQEQISVDYNHASLKIYKGNLCTVAVSMIAHCTDNSFSPIPGTCSEEIMKEGGANLANELKTQRRFMRKDKIVVTTAGNKFASEFIAHLDIYDSSSDLKNKVKLLIDKATELGIESIAIPVNEFETTIANIAEALNDVLHELQDTGGHRIEVHAVLNDDQVYHFRDELEKCMEAEQKSLIKRFAGWIGIGKSEGKSEKRSFHVSNVKPTSELKITVYAKTDQEATSALKELEMSLDTAFIQKTVNDDFIKDISTDQIQDIEEMSFRFAVEIEVKRHLGYIKITGIPENITNVLDEIHRFLRNAVQNKHSEEHYKYVSKMVQWSFLSIDIDGEKLEPYPPEINAKLERALLSDKPEEEFTDMDGKTYIVDFNTFEEYPERDPSDSVKVIRKFKVAGGGIELPPTWINMDDKEKIKIIKLDPNESEYKDVSQAFLTSLGHGNAKNIVQIKKIQHRLLYQQYMAKKTSMESDNPGLQNERDLWHGTSIGSVDSITTYGFNRSFCGKNATVYGNGVYFARDASYSARDTYSPVDSNGHKRIYMCKVLVGEFAQGKADLKVPPPKGQGHLLYDSVVDDPKNPQIFVIFQDAQAYPEYLIEFN